MHQNQPKQAGVSGGGDGLLNGTVALFLTVLAAPPIYDFTAPYVHRILASHYGTGLVEIGMFGHVVFVGVLTYLGMSKSVALAVTLMVTAMGRVSYRLPFNSQNYQPSRRNKYHG